MTASRWSAGAVVTGAALYGACVAAGWWLTRHGAHLHLGSTYPLTGQYRLHLSVWLVPAVLLGGAVLRWGARLAEQLSWLRLLGAAYATALGWAVALALVAGPAAIARPLTGQSEYLYEVDRISAMGVRTFLRTFTRYVLDTGHGTPWTTQVSGHPPLATLVFVLLARAGLAGPGWAAALVIVIGAVTAPAVLATLRLAAGSAIARRAAPYVATAPVALWIATSADALFAGVAAAGLCALAYAAAAGSRTRTGLLAAIGGVALGCCLMLSYGLVLLAPLAVAAVVLGARRHARPLPAAATTLAAAGVAAAAVLGGFAVAGFWWLDGLAITHRRVLAGVAWQERPAGYFVFANLAALAAAVGPATLAALTAAARQRRAPRAGWPVATMPAAALVAVVAAIASGLSKGEVERIYLPFAVWLPTMTGLLPSRPPSRPYGRPPWLAAQLGFALLVAATTQLNW